MNLRYARMGGDPPQDDELLQVDAKGAFTLRRVIGFGSVGQFAGTLPAEGVAEMQKLIAEAAGAAAPDPGPQRPHRVLETLQAGKHEWDLFPEWDDAGPLGQLVKFARALSGELTDEPVAALSFFLSEDARHARLQSPGDEPLAVDFAEASAEYTLFGEDQGYLDSGALPVKLPGGPRNLPPGWEAELEFPSNLDFNPERTLQARFSFRMKYDDGIWRDTQVSAIAGKGWF